MSGGESRSQERSQDADAGGAIRRSGDPAIRRSGDPAIRRSGDPAIRRSGDPAIRRSGDPAIRRSGDPAIRRSGDPAIRRSGDPAIRRSGDPAIRRSGDPAIRRSGDHNVLGIIRRCQGRIQGPSAAVSEHAGHACKRRTGLSQALAHHVHRTASEPVARHGAARNAQLRRASPVPIPQSKPDPARNAIWRMPVSWCGDRVVRWSVGRSRGRVGTGGHTRFGPPRWGAMRIQTDSGQGLPMSARHWNSRDCHGIPICRRTGTIQILGQRVLSLVHIRLNS